MGVLMISKEFKFWAGDLAQCCCLPALQAQGPEFNPWYPKQNKTNLSIDTFKRQELKEKDMTITHEKLKRGKKELEKKVYLMSKVYLAFLVQK